MGKIDFSGLIKKYSKKFLLFLKHLFIKFYKDRCLIRAAGMAYSSLLALVPLSALVFSLLTAFGVFDKLKASIQNLVFQQLLPTRQNDIIQYINIFIENTKALGVVGLLLFTITSVFLISNIQGNFNDLWNAERKRNFFSQFSVYISVILISTLLIGSGFAISGWIKSAAAKITFLRINLVIQYIITFSPKVLFSFTLFILILAVPSVKIRVSGAFLGAVSGGFLMWAVKTVFTAWSANAIRYSVIYGSIALIPIFLIWLYLIWAVILLSVEIACVWQTGGLKKKDCSVMPLFESFRESFELYLFISERYMDNSGGVSFREIASWSEDEGRLQGMLSALENLNLIHSVEKNSVIYIPSTPPHTTLTAYVIEKITGSGNNSGRKYSDIYKKIIAAGERAFSSENYKYISRIIESGKRRNQ